MVDDKSKIPDKKEDTAPKAQKDALANKAAIVIHTPEPTKRSAQRSPSATPGAAVDPFAATKTKKPLQNGAVVVTEKSEFLVLGRLGAGEFGHVYLVQSFKNNQMQHFALKTEWTGKKCSPLMRELNVYGKLEQTSNANKNTFVKMIDRGQTADFRLMVLELVGYTLNEIHKEICRFQMPLDSAVYLMMFTFDAITALHDLGFIHRDIKPHNFAVGPPPNQRKVYIMGFGVASQWIVKGQVRKPRERVPFIGTPKYCSRLTHELKEQSTRDDFESWAYMCLEWFDEDNISWKPSLIKISAAKVLIGKKKVFEYAQMLHQKGLVAPTGFLGALREIDMMKYGQNVRATNLDKYVYAVVQETKVKLDTPLKFVWEDVQGYKDYKSAAPPSHHPMAIPRGIKQAPQKKAEMHRVVNDEDSSDRRKREARKRKKMFAKIHAKIREVEEELLEVMIKIEDNKMKEVDYKEKKRSTKDKQRNAREKQRDAERKRRSEARKMRQQQHRRRRPTTVTESECDDDLDEEVERLEREVQMKKLDLGEMLKKQKKVVDRPISGKEKKAEDKAEKTIEKTGEKTVEDKAAKGSAKRASKEKCDSSGEPMSVTIRDDSDKEKKTTE